MKIQIKKYGYLQGKNLCEFTLTNDQGMQVKLLNYGATAEDVLVPLKNGEERHVILALNKPEDYDKERNFLGGTVGRIAGRVYRGQWQNGPHILQLPQNDGENHIHGGFGTDQRVWDFRPEKGTDYVSVHFSLLDYDGHNGFPGNLQLETTYTLTNDNELSCQMTAYSDKLTIFNPTNHTYFCLDGLGSQVDQTLLKLDADYYLPVKGDGVPTGEMKSVEGTVFDFRENRPVGQAILSDDEQIQARNGLDHPFVLNGSKPAAVLTASDGLVKMALTTDAPALVLYTANHFGKGRSEINTLPHFGGITLEAQAAPLPGSDLGAITVMPGKTWERHIAWKYEF